MAGKNKYQWRSGFRVTTVRHVNKTFVIFALKHLFTFPLFFLPYENHEKVTLTVTDWALFCYKSI